MRHVQSNGELFIQDREPSFGLAARFVFAVELDFLGCDAFSHFYILPEESYQNHWVVFESIHKSR